MADTLTWRDALDGHHRYAPPAARVTPRAATAAAELLDALGIDYHSDGLTDTPARFAAALAEMTAGLRGPDPATWLERTFPPGGPHPSMITVTGLDFSALCEHHMLPFHGTATVAYLPADGARIAGVSKLSRLVTSLAARPQMQERLGQQVVDTITSTLDTQGAACLLTAAHTCMTLRGARAGNNARMVTSHLTGRFLDDGTVRAEFLTLARHPT